MGFWEAIRFWDDWRQRRTDVRVRVHVAQLTTAPGRPLCCFVNVFNASPQREVTVTHVWWETEPKTHVINVQRPLPARIRSGDQWETWIPIDELRVADVEEDYSLARVQLADDSVVASVKRVNVPEAGVVPGG